MCSAPARQRVPHILRGQSVPKGDYPWHAAIFTVNDKSSQYFCGGTLISSDTVLTAAHCLIEDSKKLSPDTLLVRFGVTRLYFDGEGHEVFKTITHNLFNDYNFRHDIGLIRLKTTVEFTDFIRPACLTNENFDIVNVDGFVSIIYLYSFTVIIKIILQIPGFGSSATLNMAAMPGRSTEVCKETNLKFFDEYVDPEYNFCAGHVNGTTIGGGDSGGGLVFERSDGWYVRGIASITAGSSKGLKKVDVTKFALFADVVSHFQWIVNNMGIDNSTSVPENDEKICPAPTGVVIDYSSNERKGSYPWHCTIFFSHHQYGGTIIRDDIIITLNSTPLSKALLGEVIVKVGRNQLQGETSFYKAKSIKFHDGMRFPHQLALIKLDRKLVYSNQVKPVCLTNIYFQHFDITEWVSYYSWLSFNLDFFSKLNLLQIPGFDQGEITDNGVVVNRDTTIACTLGSIIKNTNIYCADVARTGTILRGTGLIYNFQNGLFIRGIYMSVIGYKTMIFDGSQIMDVVPYYDWIQTTIKEFS